MFELAGNMQCLEAILFRGLPVPSFDTFRFVRTSLAVMALINGDLAFVVTTAFTAAVAVDCIKPFSRFAGIEVAVVIVWHILPPADIRFVFAPFADLVISRLDHSPLAMILQIAVILFAVMK